MSENQHNEFNILKKENEELKKICERYKLVIEGSNDGIWEWDVEKDIYKVSSKDRESFDYNIHVENFTLENWKNAIHPDDSEKAVFILEDFLDGHADFYENIYRMQNKNGDYRWVLSKGKGIKNEKGKVICIAGSHTDITDKIEMEKKLYNLAYSDYLTKLSNREMLFKDFKNLVKNDLGEKEVSIFYIDIDEFGYINNTLGYDEGNRLIKKTAEFLASRYGNKHYIARVSADEFLIMYIKDKNDKIIEMELEELIKDIKNKKFFENHEIILTVSIGTAIYKEHGTDFFDLIRKADTALYSAKKNGKDQYKIYSPEMGDKVYSNIDLINQIRIGMEKDEFEMYYQPVFESKTDKPAGFEALIRWNHPFRGFIPPLEFIPVAEASGQMIALEKWIFTEVFSQVKKWVDKGDMPLFVSINLSAKGLIENNIVEFLGELLTEYKISPGKIEFEVTETAMINNMEQTMETLTKIRNLGFGISLDDFGKGYSSLNYLKRLPINKVKLDKDFIEDIENQRDQFLIKSIINLSQDLGLSVVAEGVEAVREKNLLEDLNCNFIQGFLLAKPQSVSSIEAWIRDVYKIK